MAKSLYFFFILFGATRALAQPEFCTEIGDTSSAVMEITNYAIGDDPWLS